MTTARPQPYNVRAVPQIWDKGWAMTEFQNLQRAISSLPGYPVVVDARDFGIGIGGGTNDDTADMRSGLSQLSAGTLLYLYPGSTFSVSGQLEIPASDITVWWGPGARIVSAMSAASQNVFYVTGKDRVSFWNPQISGAHRFGLFISGGIGHRIREGRVSGGTQSVGGGTCGGLYHEDLDDFFMENTRFSGNGDGQLTTQVQGDVLGNFANGKQIKNSTYTNVKCLSTTGTINLFLYDPFNVTINGGEYTGAFTPSTGGFTTAGYGLGLYQSVTVPDSLTGQCRLNSVYCHHTQGTGLYIQHMRDSVINTPVCHDNATVQQDTLLGTGNISISGDPGTILNSPRCWTSGTHNITVTWDSVAGRGNGDKMQINNPTLDHATLNGLAIRGSVNDVEVHGGVISNYGQDAIGSWSDLNASRIDVLGTKILTESNPGVSRGVYQSASATDWNLALIKTSGLTAGREFVLNGTNKRYFNTIDGVWAESSLVTNVGKNLLLTNPAGTDFGMIQLGGVTSAFGAIQRSGAGVSAVTADGFNYTIMNAKRFITQGGAVTETIVVVPYSASMTFNTTLGNAFQISANNGTAFTINAPTGPGTGEDIEITIRNISGGALGVITWNAVFKMVAFTNPANAFSRTVRFRYDGTNWVERRVDADVPN